MWKIACPWALVPRAGISKSPARWMLELRFSPASAMPPRAIATAPATRIAAVRFISLLLFLPTSCRGKYASPRRPVLGGFEPGDDGKPELACSLAVDDSMVERDRDVSHPANGDLPVADDRSLGDAVHAEDGDLRRIDQRRDDDAGELAR